MGLSLTGCSSSGSAPLGGKCPEISLALATTDLIVENLQMNTYADNYSNATPSIEILYSLKDQVGGDEAYEPIDQVLSDLFLVLRGQEISDSISIRDSTWDYQESSAQLRSLCGQ